MGDESREIMLGVCFSAMEGFSNGSFSSENVYIRLRRISGSASAMQKERAHLHGSRLLRIFVAERTNECTWYTTYSTPKGKIQLSIDNQGVMGSCFVGLRYVDKINSEAVRAQAMEDL